jgi:ribosomal protein S18 acetylase RimI-like enzyme
MPGAILQPRCRFATEADIPHERIAVMARYEVLWTRVPFLSYIYVAEAFRRRGYPRVVLEFLERYLVEQGYTLLSSSQTNEPAAQAWHVHMGFRENGIIKNIADAGIGELVYRMELKARR